MGAHMSGAWKEIGVRTGPDTISSRHVFEGVGHNLHVARAKDVNARIEAWFRKYAKAK